jgi:hypothetical protein
MGRLTPLLAQHTAQPNTRSLAPTPWAMCQLPPPRVDAVSLLRWPH